MTNHKFEPKDWVLVRDYEDAPWWLAVYSHYSEGSSYKHKMADGKSGFHQCIPYTPETARLLGTSQPYEPPKPPVEYEWGQKVKVLIGREWDNGLYIGCVPISLKHRVYTNKHGDRLFSYTEIHPLPDTAAQ